MRERDSWGLGGCTGAWWNGEDVRRTRAGLRVGGLRWQTQEGLSREGNGGRRARLGHSATTAFEWRNSEGPKEVFGFSGVLTVVNEV